MSHSVKEVASFFLTEPETVIRWASRYHRFGLEGLANKEREHRQKKLSPSAQDAIREWLEEEVDSKGNHVHWTLKRMAIEIADVLDFEISVAALGATLKQMGMAIKRPRPMHWHMDITCVHIRGKPYYMITIIDGCSRFIVAWKLFQTMEASDVGIVQQMALETFPDARPRFITDNGKQFVGMDFKEFIPLHGYTHVTTSVYYPHSNGKIERWHKSFKGECIHRKCLSDHEQACQEIGIIPRARLAGRHLEIQAERDRKLEEARIKRQNRFADQTKQSTVMTSDKAETGSAGTQPAEE